MIALILKYNMRFALIITDQMKKKLFDLNYANEDIDQLKPLEANFIITNKIKKIQRLC